MAIVPELRAVLRKHGRGRGPAGGLVFADRQGQPLGPSRLRSGSFGPALAAAKITREVRIYGRRHPAGARVRVQAGGIEGFRL